MIKYKYLDKNPHRKNVYNPSEKNSCLMIYVNILFRFSARRRRNHDMVNPVVIFDLKWAIFDQKLNPRF